MKITPCTSVRVRNPGLKSNTRVRVVYYGNVHTFFMSCHFEVLAFKFLTAVSDSVDIFERNHFKSKHKLVVEKLTYMSDI